MDGPDSGELRETLDEHAPALQRYALLVTGDTARAADVVRETMLRARRDPQLVGAPAPSVRASLFITARNMMVDQQRSAGITTALVAPREGIYQGQSALINLGDAAPEKLIVKNPVSLNVSFGSGRGFGGGYPSSLMGVFAFLRQSLLDAQHYKASWKHYNRNKRGARRPETESPGTSSASSTR